MFHKRQASIGRRRLGTNVSLRPARHLLQTPCSNPYSSFNPLPLTPMPNRITMNRSTVRQTIPREVRLACIPVYQVNTVGSRIYPQRRPPTSSPLTKNVVMRCPSPPGTFTGENDIAQHRQCPLGAPHTAPGRSPTVSIFTVHSHIPRASPCVMQTPSQ